MAGARQGAVPRYRFRHANRAPRGAGTAFDTRSRRRRGSRTAGTSCSPTPIGARVRHCVEQNVLDVRIDDHRAAPAPATPGQGGEQVGIVGSQKPGCRQQRVRQTMTLSAQERPVRLRQCVVVGTMASSGSKRKVARENVRVRVDPDRPRRGRTHARLGAQPCGSRHSRTGAARVMGILFLQLANFRKAVDRPATPPKLTIRSHSPESCRSGVCRREPRASSCMPPSAHARRSTPC